MLVDDHDLVRTGIRKMLDDVSGIKVVGEARSGEEAVKLGRQLKPNVVLMDVKMPGIGGFEATRKLLRGDPDIKVLVVTICTNDLYPARLLQIGASGYLTKGCTMEEMVQAIRAVHAGQRYISPEIASRLAFKHVSEQEDSPFDQLSERELQVMLMITMGMKVQDIAEKLCLSPKTVNSYRYRIFEKLKVKNDVELTLLAIRHGLVGSLKRPHFNRAGCMLDDPKKFLQNVSSQPGVYRMLDKQGKILYVGKAKNLQKRLTSYFRKTLDSKKTEVLMRQVTDVEITVTDSENQALLLESNLIKEHRPRYNVLLRDDKSYPYLYLSTKQDFPRLDFHRGAKNKPGRYFGPYPSAGSVRENLALIQKLFKVRQCKDSFFNNRTRPCLQYQIERCTAPCVNYVTKEEYAKQVKHTILFLEGKNEEIMHELARQMETASQALNYEDAGYYRDLIQRLRQLQTKQVITGDQGDIDIIGLAQQQGKTAVAVLFVRSGRLIGNKAYFPNVPADTEPGQVLAAFIPQFYLSPLRGEQMVEQIVLSDKLPDKTWIQNALYEELRQKIKITDQRIPGYRQWQSLAQSNAKYALASHLAQQNNVALQLEALQKALSLPNPASRIECFDISHTMGEATVASCVVYGIEGPLNKEYRRFNIKDINTRR